jgi:signal transduction histidine kinase
VAVTNSQASAVAEVPYTWGHRTTLVNLVSLALLIWGLSAQAHIGTSGRHLAAAVLLGLASVGWVSWVLLRGRPRRPVVMASLAVMAAAGGGLVAYGTLAAVFVGVAALGASVDWPISRAVAVVAVGWAGVATGLLVTGYSAGLAVGAIAAGVAGVAGGLSRRQAQAHVAERALLRFEKERAEVEHQRAQLLEERNHLAREMHDVLAHTLSALSVQLEALDSVVHDKGPPPADVERQLERSKRLLREGLEEARRAVKALRAAPTPLLDQMARLAEADGVTFRVSGQARALDAETSLALYRAAQEGVANVVKHAPGAPALVVVSFASRCVSLTVTNPSSSRQDGLAAGAGSGLGLQGMSERVAALGGTVHAGPQADGWSLEVEVPA